MTDEHRAAIVSHDGFLQYDFGPYHPLRPERISAGFALLESAGLWNRGTETIAARPAAQSELELVHASDYIQAVEEASRGWYPSVELARYGLTSGDNPAFPHMHESSALLAGGCVAAARLVMAGEIDHAFHPAGGLHHAHRDHASGFCIYNDPAVAIAVVLAETDARVMYIDLDCHHGDGVQWLFFDEPRVLTVSFHESGQFLFPGTGSVEEVGSGEGYGFSANIPFQPFTRDASWQEAIEDLVPPLAERFQPNLVVSSHGADTHVWDPLTHLSLSTESFVHQARFVHDLAHRHCQGRWIAVGSGGYDWRRVVPRAWAIVWCEMTQRPLPEHLPDDWRHRWMAGAETPFPHSLLDSPDVNPATPRDDEIIRQNARQVARLKELLGLS